MKVIYYHILSRSDLPFAAVLCRARLFLRDCIYMIIGDTVLSACGYFPAADRDGEGRAPKLRRFRAGETFFFFYTWLLNVIFFRGFWILDFGACASRVKMAYLVRT